MADNLKRLDGWKAIAAHFRRNRSTVIRWAEAGDFPVHRVGGRAGASVWAFAHELDAWLAKGDPTLHIDLAESIEPAVVPETTRRDWRPWMIGATCAILLFGGMAATLLLSPSPTKQSIATQALPSNPAVADLYLQARDDWSTRTPARLSKAMVGFGEVISRDPGFALAYSGLADVYIAKHDYAAMPDALAFSKADAAARAALAIDSDNADANRVLGFTDYWSRHDIRSARDHFSRSLRVQPSSAQTHFWFGSTLCDTGAYDESLRELRSARLQDPGSKVIEMYYAWALWLRGPGDPGLAELEDIADHGAPNLTHKLLASIFLSKGDIVAFLDQNEHLARLLEDAEASAYVMAERAAYRRSGNAGLLDLVVKRPPPVDLAGSNSDDLSATLLSLERRRNQLLAILTRASAEGEHWPTWRPDQARYAMWRGDRQVTDRLDRLIANRSN